MDAGGRYTNRPAIALARKLAELAPGDLSRVLFTTSGATANSAAIQLARVATGRHKTISMWDAFHGGTLDTISIGGEAQFRAGIGPLMTGTEHVPPPEPYRCPFRCFERAGACDLTWAAYLEYVLEKEGDVAAVIAETVRNTPSIPPPDYWQVSTRKREVSDGKAEDATRQPEQISAFRDTWKDGIHSYLGYLRDRLVAARELLTDTGSVFVQIGDQNQHLVRAVLDEVFGSENFCSLITFRKTSGATGDLLPGTTDYIVWYARRIEEIKFRALYRTKTFGGDGAGAYSYVELPDGTRRRLGVDERDDVLALPAEGRVFRLDNLTSQSAGREKGEGAASWFAVPFEGREFRPTQQSRWKTNEIGMTRLLAARRLGVAGNTLSYVRYIDDFPAFPINNAWDDTTIAGFGDPKVYVVQTNVKVIERCLLMTTDPGDLVLDPTCGSGTTAYVAEQWGRRWITIDTSRVALALARTRLMAAKYPYYLMADTPEGQRREAQLTGVAAFGSTEGDIRKGFVYDRVPHVTLKSIAQNPEIREGMTRAEIDAAIARISTRRSSGSPGRSPSRASRPTASSPMAPRISSTRRPRSRTPAASSRRSSTISAPPESTTESRASAFASRPSIRSPGASSRPPARSARARPLGVSLSRSGRSTAPSGRTSSARPPSRPAATSTSWSCAASPSTPGPTRKPARRCASED